MLLLSKEGKGILVWFGCENRELGVVADELAGGSCWQKPEQVCCPEEPFGAKLGTSVRVKQSCRIIIPIHPPIEQCQLSYLGVSRI